MRTRPATVALIVINTAIFLLMGFLGNPQDAGYMLKCGALLPTLVTEEGQWWRLFTACFLHFNISHAANNMLMLGAIGSYVEPLLGNKKFLTVYLLTGIIGNAVTVAVASAAHDYSVSAGASGAVFGITGALLAIVIKNGGRVEKLSLKGMILMIFLAVFAGITSTGINNTAHIAGLLSGIVFTFLLYRRPKPISVASEIVPEKDTI